VAVSQLHRHALECVFAFCSRAELAVAVVVARDWQAAALSMASLQWTTYVQEPADVRRLCSSPLRRHVDYLSCFGDAVAADPESLQLLSARMAHLNGLDITVRLPLPSHVTLQFPARLRLLDLTLHFEGGGRGGSGRAVQCRSRGCH